MTPKRQAFCVAALSQIGKPYIWDGKGPDTFDCSGLVTHSLWAAKGADWRNSHNAQALFDETETPTGLRPGDLCFYGSGPDGIDHVTIWLVDGLVVGALGGNHDVTSPRPGASVQVRSSHLYRPGFVGFRRIPWLDQ